MNDTKKLMAGRAGSQELLHAYIQGTETALCGKNITVRPGVTWEGVTKRPHPGQYPLCKACSLAGANKAAS